MTPWDCDPPSRWRYSDLIFQAALLITYPNLGHFFYPSPQWSAESGPIEPYVLADLYAWLESHSGFTRIHTSSDPTLSLSTNSTSKRGIL